MGLDKCTPGKWHVRFLGGENDGENDFFVESRKQEGQAYGIEIMMDDYGNHNNYPREQRLADAKLIAASKGMYEALVNISQMSDVGSFEKAITDIKRIASEALPKL